MLGSDAFLFNAVTISLIVYDMPCDSSQQWTKTVGAVLSEEKKVLALKASCIPTQCRQDEMEILARHTGANSHSHRHGSVA